MTGANTSLVGEVVAEELLFASICERRLSRIPPGLCILLSQKDIRREQARFG